MLEKLRKTLFKNIPPGVINFLLRDFIVKILLRFYVKKFNKTVTYNSSSIEIIDTLLKQKIIINLKHLNYCFEIVKDFNFYFESVVPSVINEFYVVNFSTKAIHELKTNQKNPIFYYFNSFAETYDSTLQYIEALKIKDGDFVVDIGAYCGSTSIEFSKVNPNGVVVGIEPDFLNYNTFKDNLLLHQCKNVIPIHAAIDSCKKVIKFSSEGNMGSSSHKVVMKNITYVSTITFNEVEKLIGKKIDILKIDIEGAELDLIKNSENYFKTNKPKLVIEPHYDHQLEQLNTEEVIKYLKKYGYNDIQILSQSSEIYPLIFAQVVN